MTQTDVGDNEVVMPANNLKVTKVLTPFGEFNADAMIINQTYDTKTQLTPSNQLIQTVKLTEHDISGRLFTTTEGIMPYYPENNLDRVFEASESLDQKFPAGSACISQSTITATDYVSYEWTESDEVADDANQVRQLFDEQIENIKNNPRNTNIVEREINGIKWVTYTIQYEGSNLPEHTSLILKNNTIISNGSTQRQSNVSNTVSDASLAHCRYFNRATSGAIDKMLFKAIQTAYPPTTVDNVS